MTLSQFYALLREPAYRNLAMWTTLVLVVVSYGLMRIAVRAVVLLIQHTVGFTVDRYLTERGLTSTIISWCSRYHDLNLRNTFRNFEMSEARPVGGHTHPDAAANRYVGNQFIDNLIERLGYKVFSISMSTKDMRAGHNGTRAYHFSKDLAMPVRCDRHGPQHIIKMVDVDYYVSMPWVLSYGRPVLLYTLVPLNVASTTPNGFYYIQNDHVHMKVSGGAEYVHRVWDYDCDSFTINYWWGSISYLVETRMTKDPTRRVILLEPTRTVYGPLGWLLSGKLLNRKTYSINNTTINQFFQNDKLSISFKEETQQIDCVVPYVTFITAKGRVEAAKEPSISDVERIFRADDVSQPSCAAVTFMRCARDLDMRLLGPVVTVPKYSDPNYQTLSPLILEDAKPTARIIGYPMMQGNVAPGKSFNNDTACVKGRITGIRNPDKPVPPFYNQARSAFLKMLIPDDVMHTGVPFEEEYIRTLQNRPTQRRANDQVRWFAFLQNVVVRSFQKAETYAKVCDPRNISTLNPDHRLRYSAFMYSIKQHFKQFRWYAFGKHPREFVSRLRDIAAGCSMVVPTDFSRFDGTHGKFLCELEEMALRRYFSPQYHAEVVKLHSKQFNLMATTAHGVRYNTGYSRLSGSAETSDFNTICNAFVAFLALHHNNSEQFAWNKLGLYGGDDGLTPDISPEIYTRVADKLGLKLKAEVVLMNQPVTFLGRIFVDIWTTSSSICDVKRRVGALHLTVQPSTLPDRDILVRRAQSYLVTDAYTPLIAEWARAILRVYGSDTIDNFLLAKEESWFCQYDNPFPQDGPHDPLAIGIVAEQLGISCHLLSEKCKALNSAVLVRHLDLGMFIPGETPVECDVELDRCVRLGPTPTPAPVVRAFENHPNAKQSQTAPWRSQTKPTTGQQRKTPTTQSRPRNAQGRPTQSI